MFGKDPEDQADVRWLLDHLGSVDKKTMHDVARLLTGSAADWLDDYFEHEAVKGYHASSSIIGSKVGPMSQGSGLVLLFHKMGEHDGAMGAWAFHKGGNGGFTQVLARAAESFGAEVRLEAPVASVLTDGDRTTGVVLADGTEIRATHGRARPSTRAAPSPSSSTRAHCPTTSSTPSSAPATAASRPR